MVKRKANETSVPVDENADQWLTTRNKRKISPAGSHRKPGGRLPVRRILTANTAARLPLLSLLEENQQKQGVAATHQTSLLRFFSQRLKPLPQSSTLNVDTEIEVAQENPPVASQPSGSQEEEGYSYVDRLLWTQGEGEATADSWSTQRSGVTSPLSHSPQKIRLISENERPPYVDAATFTLNSTGDCIHREVTENVCDADAAKRASDSPRKRCSAEKHGESWETEEIKRRKLEANAAGVGGEAWQNASGINKDTENPRVCSADGGMHIGHNDGTLTTFEITVSDSDSQDTVVIDGEDSLQTPAFLQEGNLSNRAAQIKNKSLVHAATGTLNSTTPSGSMHTEVDGSLAEPWMQTPAFLREKPDDDNSSHCTFEGLVAEQTYTTAFLREVQDNGAHLDTFEGTDTLASQLETPAFLQRRYQDISTFAHTDSYTVNSTAGCTHKFVNPLRVGSGFSRNDSFGIIGTKTATDTQRVQTCRETSDGSFPGQAEAPSVRELMSIDARDSCAQDTFKSADTLSIENSGSTLKADSSSKSHSEKDCLKTQSLLRKTNDDAVFVNRNVNGANSTAGCMDRGDNLADNTMLFSSPDDDINTPDTPPEITKESGSFGMSALGLDSQESDCMQLRCVKLKEKSSLELNLRHYANSSLESDDGVNDVHNDGMSGARKANPLVHAATATAHSTGGSMHKMVKRPDRSGIKDRRNENVKQCFDADTMDDLNTSEFLKNA